MTYDIQGLTPEFLLEMADAAVATYRANFEDTLNNKSIYVAGPMRGYPGFNFDAFFDAEDNLRDAGWGTVYNPAANDLANGFNPYGMDGTEHCEGFDLVEALKWDMDKVLTADAIYMLDGWDKSKGATAEYHLAVAAGKQVLCESKPKSKSFTTLISKEKFDADAPTVEALRQGFQTDFSWENLLAADPEGSSYGAAVVLDKPAEVGDKVTIYPIKADAVPDERFVAKGGEVRTTSSTGGQKGVKSARFDLVPIGALTQLAEHYGVGALKYADNQWRRGYEWSKSYAALQRHLTAWWGGEDIDEETGSSHMAAVAWHAFTLLTFIEEHPDFDDRFVQESPRDPFGTKTL